MNIGVTHVKLLEIIPKRNTLKKSQWYLRFDSLLLNTQKFDPSCIELQKWSDVETSQIKAMKSMEYERDSMRSRDELIDNNTTRASFMTGKNPVPYNRQSWMASVPSLNDTSHSNDDTFGQFPSDDAIYDQLV